MYDGTHIESQVRMLQSLLDRHPLLGIKRLRRSKNNISTAHLHFPASHSLSSTYQSPVQEIDGVRARIRKHCRERPSFPDIQSSDIVPRTPRGDRVELLDGRRADDVEDEVELVTVVSSGEERASAQAFSENATNGPHVNCLYVTTRR